LSSASHGQVRYVDVDRLRRGEANIAGVIAVLEHIPRSGGVSIRDHGDALDFDHEMVASGDLNRHRLELQIGVRDIVKNQTRVVLVVSRFAKNRHSACHLSSP